MNEHKLKNYEILTLIGLLEEEISDFGDHSKSGDPNGDEAHVKDLQEIKTKLRHALNAPLDGERKE